jgi:hypothetical protein
LLARGRIHGARIIALRFAAAIGANDFIQMGFDKLFKPLIANGALILQKGHNFNSKRFVPHYYTPNAAKKASVFIKR